MPAWKVLLIMAFGCAFAALFLATLIVPTTMIEDWTRWPWLGGLVTATVIAGTLFRLFLNSADRAMTTR